MVKLYTVYNTNVHGWILPRLHYHHLLDKGRWVLYLDIPTWKSSNNPYIPKQKKMLTIRLENNLWQ